jgi:shikimate kinase
MNESGYLQLRRIEEEEILALDVEKHVIATGGSAVYSERAMNHLQDMSMIIFLEVDFETIRKRIYNFETRGIAKAKTQTFRDLFDERQVLYKRYANMVIDCNRKTQEDVAEIIARELRGGCAA